LVATTPDAPTTISLLDLRHSRDAAAGVARARFESNFLDPFNASVVIRFHDGVSSTVVMDAMNPRLPARRSWRLDVGDVPPGPSFGPTAAPG
jgi:hypothetical protein